MRPLCLCGGVKKLTHERLAFRLSLWSDTGELPGEPPCAKACELCLVQSSVQPIFVWP